MYNSNYILDSMAWIQGTDIFNSGMCRKLRNMNKRRFIVRVDCTRIDLICEKIYGSSNKQLISLLILLNAKDTFKVDEVVYYVDINDLRFT